MHVADAEADVAEIFFGGEFAGELEILVGEIELILHSVKNAALEDEAVGLRIVVKTDFDDFEAQVEGVVIGAKGGEVDVVVFVLGSKLGGLAKGVDGGLKLIGAFEADVLHAHNIGALTVPMAALAHRLFRKRSRLVISPHHHAKGSKTHTRIAWLAYKPFAQKTLKDADKVHAVSSYEASLLRRDFGIDPVLVPNGIGSDVFGYGWQPPQGEAIITYAGRMERYKRVESLVRALSIAQKMTGRKARLRLTGSRDGVGAVMDLGRTLSVQIEQLGYLPREDYLTRLAGSTVLANVSRYEAYSLVTAEALAMGVPVVVSKPWGYAFLGPKTTRVDGEDVEEIAGALAQRILGSQEGMGGKIVVPTWRVTAKRIVEELYE